MAEYKAIARYVRVSPQKARLVVDLIRGKRAEEALHLLEFTRKSIAPDVLKLLRSAIANATDLGEVDVDRLYVVRAWVGDGPRQKRIRPAPMGRAYRYQRRSAHIELHVGERPPAGATVPGGEAAAAASAPTPAPRTPAHKTAPRKPAHNAAPRKPATKPGKAAGKGKAKAPAAHRGKKAAAAKKAAHKPGSGKAGE